MQIRRQRQNQRGWKLYSWHAPETECIGKGMALLFARARYRRLAHDRGLRPRHPKARRRMAEGKYGQPAFPGARGGRPSADRVRAQGVPIAVSLVAQ